jgi:ParB/RepB/Spo0J family partition protein
MKQRTDDTDEATRHITKLEKILLLPLVSIRANAQVRERVNEESIEGLIASIREVGLLCPIRVRVEGEFYVIVDGERRWRAYRKMGMESIAAILDEGHASDGVITLKQYIANCQREDFNVIEKAIAIDRLMQNMHWTSAQVAEKLGESKPMTTRYLGLLKLSDELRQKVARGEIGVSAGYELAQITDPVRQAEIAKKLSTGELSRDALVGLRKSAARKKPDSATSIRRATTIVSTGHTVMVSGNFLDMEIYISAIEEILGQARKIRQRGVSLETFLAILNDQNRSAEKGATA